MADDRDPRAPASVRRRGDDHDTPRPDDDLTSPLRTGAPSVPIRVHPQARRTATATPAVVPLARRRTSRLGPRPGNRPGDGSRPPAAALPTAPTTKLPTSAPPGAPPAGTPVDETPTTATPVSPGDDQVTERVPTRGAGPRAAGPETSVSGMPTERLRASPGADGPRGAPAAPTGTAAGPRPTPPQPPPAPATPAAAVATTAAAGATPAAAGAPERAATSVSTHEPEWAATSTVVAGVGTRLANLRRTWTWLRTGKLVAAMTAFMVVATTGLAWGGLAGLVREVGALDPDSSAIRDAAAQRGDQNFLVVGSDTRIGTAPDEDAGDAADVPGARADTVMVVHVPQDRSRVTVVSFPRDLEISRPACEHWDPVSGQYSSQSVPRTPQVKLNSAYAAGGPRCVTRVVQELSGLAINHFLGVDFQGFKGMVDAVHGVPICTEKPIRDGILGSVIPRAGTSVLSGDQALNFVRARHVVGDPTSDYGRIQRQQRFLSSLLRTTLSAGTLLDPGKLRGFVDAVGRSTFGENVGAEQLLGLGQSLGDLNPATVTFTTIPTTGTANSRGNEVPRESADRDLFGAIIDNRPLPGQAPPPPAPGAPPGAPAPPPLIPQQVTARLVDARDSGSTKSSGASSDDASSGSSAGSSSGSSSSGGSSSGGSGDGSRMSGAAVASALRSEGFTVVPTTDAVVVGERTTLRFSPDQAPAAVLLGRSVPGAALDPSAPTPGTLTLVLGDDFDGNVGKEAAQRTVAPVVPTITAADARCG